MTDTNQKKTFLIVAILLLIPALFLFIPNHTFTKKLKSKARAKEKVAFNFVETDIDGPPNKGTPVLDGVDGPYIFKKKKKTVEIQVKKTSIGYDIVKKEIADKATHDFTCYVDNKVGDFFNFKLRKKYEVPPHTYSKPEKLLAISDFEGNFDAFYSLLIANQVMDTCYNWTYGDGHLVIAGDMMDRGVNVTQCLWLIYKLEQGAEKVGGMVHFILGNHEVMNLHGIIDYVEPKYLALALALSEDKNPRNAYISLMSKNQELVKWMYSKNIMEKIGDMLFVHGGISSELVNSKLKLKRINMTARRMLAKNYALAPIQDRDIQLINGRMGPLWYRGMATSRGKHYNKATPEEVEKVLKRFEVKHVVIGHTPVRKMNAGYEGGVITINLLQPKAKFSGKAKAFLAEEDVFYTVNDLGDREVIYQVSGGVAD